MFQGGIRAILTGRIGVCAGATASAGHAGPQGNWAAVAINTGANLTTTLAHEIGHVLLNQGESAHTTDTSQLMGTANGTGIPGCDTWERTNPGTPFNCRTSFSTGIVCENMRAEASSLSLTRSPFGMDREPLGFEWTYGRPNYGNAQPVVWNESSATGGRGSIQVPASYTEITSPAFRTADVYAVGDQIAVDVFVPATVANPWWVGSVALSFTSVATSTWSWIGQVDLTSLPRGTWSTLTFTVPGNVRALLLGDSPGAQFIVTTNTSSTGLLVDSLRFGGALTGRTLPHRSGSGHIDVATTPLLDFEHSSDWSSSAEIGLDDTDVSHGQTSLSVQASGWTTVTSRWFTTAELPTATAQMGVDVFVPLPEVNPWWTGEVRLEATCPDAGVYNAFIGNMPLTNLFLDEFNHVAFAVPSPVQQAFAASGTCQLRVILNVMADAGTFRLDRLGFE
jgi:hypothetical protein